MPQEERSKLLMVLRSRLDRAPMAALTPMADRARLTDKVNMLEHKWRQWFLRQGRGRDLICRTFWQFFDPVPPEVLPVVASVLELLAYTHPNLLVKLTP